MTPEAPVVVVGYDGSELARAALSHAVESARGGRVIAVHGREAPPPQLNDRWRSMLAASHEQQGQQILNGIVREAGDDFSGVQLETRLLSGDPAEAVVRAAREADADLIVVGSHGYGAFSALLGSVSHDVLRKADRPVTVLPRRALPVAQGGDR